MTTKEELARRAVASKHWRWMPGVATTGGATLWPGRLMDGDTVHYVDEDGCEGVSHVDDLDDLPDLGDPATLGCLLHLVREAWGDPNLGACGFRLRVWTIHLPDRVVDGETEAGALVAALEAAP